MVVYALIPARAGSRSVPKKNIRALAGKPLIAYSIESARACATVKKVFVSTDSEEIAAISRKLGADVPFLRPSELGGDSTPDLPVFEHCIAWLKEAGVPLPDAFLHLRPTSPLRSTNLIERAIRLLQESPEADSVRTVSCPRQNPFKMWRLSASGYLSPLVDAGIKEAYNQPRQVLPQVYWQNGCIDLIRTSTLCEKKSMTGDKIKALVMDESASVDIDDEFSFSLAELTLSGRPL
jgi:N-acylneuraminate cytidylyltransferase